MKTNNKIAGVSPIHRSTGLELKDLTDAITNIITMIKFIENKKVIYETYYMKLHGQAASTTACLYKTSGVEVSNRILTVYYWFENMWCD